MLCICCISKSTCSEKLRWQYAGWEFIKCFRSILARQINSHAMHIMVDAVQSVRGAVLRAPNSHTHTYWVNYFPMQNTHIHGHTEIYVLKMINFHAMSENLITPNAVGTHKHRVKNNELLGHCGSVGPINEHILFHPIPPTTQQLQCIARPWAAA